MRPYRRLGIVGQRAQAPVEGNRLVVISKYACLARGTDEVNTCCRIGAVPNHVSKTDNRIGLMLLSELQRPGQCLQIGVNVGEDSDSHRRSQNVEAEDRVFEKGYYRFM